MVLLGDYQQQGRKDCCAYSHYLLPLTLHVAVQLTILHRAEKSFHKILKPLHYAVYLLHHKCDYFRPYIIIAICDTCICTL